MSSLIYSLAPSPDLSFSKPLSRLPPDLSEDFHSGLSLGRGNPIKEAERIEEGVAEVGECGTGADLRCWPRVEEGARPS